MTTLSPDQRRALAVRHQGRRVSLRRTLSPDQRRALAVIVSAVVDTIRDAGSLGAPGGVLYAALIAHGCSLSQFQSLMSALERAGKVTREGDVYFAIPVGR